MEITKPKKAKKLRGLILKNNLGVRTTVNSDQEQHTRVSGWFSFKLLHAASSESTAHLYGAVVKIIQENSKYDEILHDKINNKWKVNTATRFTPAVHAPRERPVDIPPHPQKRSNKVSSMSFDAWFSCFLLGNGFLVMPLILFVLDKLDKAVWPFSSESSEIEGKIMKLPRNINQISKWYRKHPPKKNAEVYAIHMLLCMNALRVYIYRTWLRIAMS